MPPRYAYWTIIAGGLPTAFRAAVREELLPTFRRIKEKHPDAQMKYFARGKLWESQGAARTAEQRKGTRGRDWRPGGDHRDPRQKFIDAKKQRNASVRKDRWQRKNAEGVRGQVSAKPQSDRPPFNKPHGDRPHGSRPQGSGSRPQGKRPFGDRRPWERKPWVRGQGTEEPQQPPRPRGPNREPRPDEEPEPSPPPRPDQPIVPAPGPPERGARSRRPFQPRGRFPKGPRR